MAIPSLKSLMLASLALAPLAGCGPEELESSPGETSALASTRQALTNNGSEYVFVTQPKDWAAAQSHCQGLGAGFNLVTVNDSQEEAFLAQQQQLFGRPIWWIGHNDRANEGRFTWASGSSAAYLNYLPGEPNDALTGEDCTQDGWGSGQWNDFNCADAKPFICELSTNMAPVVSAGIGASGNTLGTLELLGSATDAEGDALSLRWTFTRGAGVESWAHCTFGSPTAAATTVSCDDDGVYTVTLTADDGVHPPVSSSAQVTLSNASKVTACNLPRYTKNPTLKLCGWVTSGSDGGAITSVWFSVDGGPAIPVTPELSGGFFSTSHTLAEGSHVVRLYAQSVKGNVTLGQKRVDVDLTAPSLQVLSPTALDVNASALVNVVSAASDASPVKVTTMRMVSTQLESGSGSVTHTVDLGGTGWFTVLVQAQDAAGNVSEVRTRVYVKP